MTDFGCFFAIPLQTVVADKACIITIGSFCGFLSYSCKVRFGLAIILLFCVFYNAIFAIDCISTC